MNELFKEFLLTFLTVLATGVATFTVKLLSAKIEQIVSRTKDERKINFLHWVENDVIIKCINTTTQTFVEELKNANSFNKEAQKQALDKTLENILVLLTDADKELLSTYVDDIDTWIETRIEAYMHQKSIQNKKDTE